MGHVFGVRVAASFTSSTTGASQAGIWYRLDYADGTVAEGQAFVALNASDVWQRVQLGVRAQQAGTLTLSVGSAEPSGYTDFDDLTVEQTGGMIVQEQHQSAYGVPLVGLNYAVDAQRYRYGYQGQYAEHDAETGYEGFELRLYNARIGRWMSPDPAGQFHSPYVGLGNEPVAGVDPDGGLAGPGNPGHWLVGGTRYASQAAAGAGKALTTGAQAIRSAGAAVTRTVLTALEASDAWATDGRGEAFGRGLANMHPWVAAMNAYSGFTTGLSIYNTPMDHDAKAAALFTMVTPAAAEGEAAEGAGGWLQRYEGPGHTLARHVGQTDAQLVSRLLSSPKISGASTFLNQATAESVIATTIRANRAIISAWLRKGASDRLTLNYVGNATIGRGIMKGQSVVSDLTNARVVLKASGGGKYGILTAFTR